MSNERPNWGWANPEFASAIRERVKEVVDNLDPIGLLAIGSPPDEYEAEVRLIVAKPVRYKSAPAVDELQSLLHGTFVDMFDDDAGPPSEYRDAAAAIAALWEEE